MAPARLSDADGDAIRQDILDWLKTRPDLTANDLGKYTDLPENAVRKFMSGHRNGEYVGGKLRAALEQARRGDILVPGEGKAVIMAEEKQAVRRVKARQHFYETQTARRISEVLDYCAENRVIGVVTADFGAGKTEAVAAWRRPRG